MGETNEKGNLAEMKVAERFVEDGQRVSFPHGDGSPYDLIRDDGELHRVQVKHAKASNGTIHVNIHTRYKKEGEWVSTTHSKDTIDEYAVWCPETDEVYTIPVEEPGDYRMTLRLSRAEKETSRINWAESYRL